MVIRLWMVQALVEGGQETVIAMVWVTDGIDPVDEEKSGEMSKKQLKRCINSE